MIMYRSKGKAEQAALNGASVQEFDTQQCRELQEAIISSSPEKPAACSNPPIPTVASNNSDINATNNDKGPPAGDGNHHSQVQEVFDEIEALRASESNSPTREQNLFVSDPILRIEQINDGPLVNFNSASQNSTSHTLKRKRENGDDLRSFKTNGTEYSTKQTARWRAMAEELTQKSDLSPTQENSASVYEVYGLRRSKPEDVRGSDPELSSSPPIPVEQDSLSELQSQVTYGDPSTLPNSTHTGWTAHTYEENDTGHINFDGFQPTSAPGEGHFESQDPPVVSTARDSVQENHTEPKTPAPSVNPFSEKGSVMKQHELFSATQPSSIGRMGGSPSSSRPSPDVYDGIRSSQEVEPSPLVRRSEVTNGISQGAMRSLLRSVSTETPMSTTPARILPQAQSFNSGPRKPTFIREPQNHYVSMKESQERRRKLSHREVSSGSESDSDFEPVSKKQKRAEIDRRVREDMSKIKLRRPISSGKLGSAKDSKTTPAAASRSSGSINHRRASSDATTYSHTPQPCEGFEAQDTQTTQQDMIADSQAAPISSNIVASSPMPGPRKRAPPSTYVDKSGTEPTSPPQGLPKQLQQPASTDNAQISDRNMIGNVETSQCMDSSGPRLTNQNEMPFGRKTSTAPVTQTQGMLSDDIAATVPETSPATDRLKPMTEIADVSFSLENDDQFDDLPGFTEDTEFIEAMGLSRHQTPQRQLQFQLQVVATPNPITPITNAPAAPVSSGLSSAPSTLDPPTPIAEIVVIPAVRQTSETISVDHNSREEEQLTEPPVLNPPVQTPKADPEKLSPLATTEDDAEGYQGTPTEETHLPSPKRRRESVPHISPRKSTQVSKNQPKKQTYSKTQTNTARSTRLSSVSSTVSTPALSIAAPDMASTSNFKSSTNSRQTRNGASKAKDTTEDTPLPIAKRGRPRKSLARGETESSMSAPPTRRKSILPPEEGSEDPLALSSPPSRKIAKSKKLIGNLFNDMAFAISYVSAEKDKENVTRMIKQYGGRLLDDGFENLFTPLAATSRSRTEENAMGETGLEVLSSQTNLGFVALIADEHSRKTKYMQALALGLPCISGRWVSDCVAKGTIIDWLPYLLSAGHSSFLGGAVKSRYLRPYSAADATLNVTFNERNKLLEGKSILMVTGKGKPGETRKPYIFLTRALGPIRLGLAQDLKQAKEKLLDAESKNADYEWLYVDGKHNIEAAVFESTPATIAGGTRKRRRSSVQEKDGLTPTPKRIRVVNDEFIIQSLILGQLIEE